MIEIASHIVRRINRPIHGRILRPVLRQSFRHSVQLFVLTAGLSVGCADMITFSKDSHDRGMQLYADKDYPNAAGAFRNAVRQVPNDYEDHYYLARCYAIQSQWQQAIQSYHTAWDVMNMTNLGRADSKMRYQVLDGLADAIARSDTRDSDLNAAEQKAHERQSADDYLLLGKIFANRSDPDSAIDAYNRAALIDPQNFYIAKEYGLYLERLGQNQKAEIPLRRAYSIDSGDEEVKAALRRIGIVPGPSIKNQDDLAKPLIPKGPIPQVDLNKMIGGDSAAPTNGAPAPAPTPPPKD